MDDDISTEDDGGGTPGFTPAIFLSAVAAAIWYKRKRLIYIVDR